ncbi:MAG TPA: pilus assembly protein N-terminal domain-containing protein, partial [Anaerolineae bacterium]
MKGKLHLRQQSVCWVTPAVLLLILFILPVDNAWAQTNAVPPFEKSMKLGGSEMLDFDGIERTAVTDPLIVDYVVLSTRQVMLITKKPGEANLYIW